jgi:hypothetical protein
MALAFPLLAGLLVAPLLGGRLQRIADTRLRMLPLFFTAIALNLAAFPPSVLPWRTPDGISTTLWLAAYLLLALACIRNWDVGGIPLVSAGLTCNLAAILANGGHMPALPSALRAAGLHYHASRNSVAAAAPHLPWLVDRWAAPGWIPFASVFSVGDILIGLGGFIFVLSASGALRHPILRGSRSERRHARAA